MFKSLHYFAQLSRRGQALLVAMLCLLHVWMAASTSRHFNTTVDEIVHLTAGYAYWTHQDYRLQPENGIFPQRWCALPLLAQKLTFPSTTTEAWRHADVWQVGHQFFHQSGNDLDAMLAAGRGMNALLSGLLCLSVFLLTRALFGPVAGLLALGLAVFSPTLLAHGGLITSDTAAALGFTLGVFAWWRLLQQPTPGRLFAAGLANGFLLTAKHSAVLLAPIIVLLTGLRFCRRQPLRWRGRQGVRVIAGWRRVPALLPILAIPAILGVLLLWAAYGFRFSAAPASASADLQFVLSWDKVLLKTPPVPPTIMADGYSVGSTDQRPGVVQHFVTWAHQHRLLPEAWLYGLAFVEKNSRGRLAFFAGEYRLTGWPEFFPTLFALKTTLPALGLMALGTVALFALARRSRHRHTLIYRLSPVLVLLLVYWAFSLQSRLNIGHRHLLPIYPACYLLAGASVTLIGRARFLGLLIAGLLAWHVGESVAIRPHYLAYFNSLAGGPDKAHRIAVDSSLDWGQDLANLKRWLDNNAGAAPVFLSYFGSGDPVHTGIKATRFGDAYFDWAPRPMPARLTGGTYCISATMLRRVYTHVRGQWSPDFERHYQNDLLWLREGGPAAATQVGTSNYPRLFNYEQLMFGRLCFYLEHRPPDARIGHSILVYRLSDDDIQFALGAPYEKLVAFRAEYFRGKP